MDMQEYMQVALMPTTQSFLEFLSMHAGKDAPLGQFGYRAGARGELVTEEQAAAHPDLAPFKGQFVFDACGLVECFVGKRLEGSNAQRLRDNYVIWCEGHVGEGLDSMVQLPGGAVFRADESGEFTDMGYLYRKTGDGPRDWDIFVCNEESKGLEIMPLQDSFTHWGLINMVMRYNVHGEMTKHPQTINPGDEYAYVYSSVLNCRDGQDDHLITSVPNGTLLKLTGRTRPNWTEAVLGDGTIGWLFSKFLVKHRA